MKVLILGAGVIGVTASYYLAKAGHDVTVIERQPGPALETSFANAGEITPGYASPWAAPGVPIKAMKWIFDKYAPFKVRLPLDTTAIRWMGQMWANCTAEKYLTNTMRMITLAEYSRQALIELRSRLDVAYDSQTLGTLHLFRNEKDLVASSGHNALLTRFGIPFEVLDRDACLAAEPGLATSPSPIAGGVRLPNDETGDCYKFSSSLAKSAESLGVRFHYNTMVEALDFHRDTIRCVKTSKGDFDADQVVVALGSYSPNLVRPLGLKVPVYPLKGYSLTVPITDNTVAPLSTVLDDRFKVAITRLGDRIRVGGIAEISGFSNDLPQARLDTLKASLRSLFPRAADIGQAKYWSGLRPMTPDGTPIIGRTGFRNLLLSTGHGTFGWTMACGTGKMLASLVAGETLPFNASEYSLARYSA